MKNKDYSKSFTDWFHCHYVLVINIFLLVFLILTILAPVFMELGFEGAGKALYLFFRQFCHQFVFRSWFLFGVQTYYPSAIAIKPENWLTYEKMFGVSADDLVTARSILGNETAGYKIAICQRDFAMYLSMLIFGLIFLLSKNRIDRIPFWIWLILGVLPLVLDGLTQLSSTGWSIFDIVIIWESTPLIRTITGSLFGFLSGWYIFPSIEASLLIKNNK